MRVPPANALRRTVSTARTAHHCRHLVLQMQSVATPLLLVAIARGGLHVAAACAYRLRCMLLSVDVDQPFDPALRVLFSRYRTIVIVDDVSDTGYTLKRVLARAAVCAAANTDLFTATLHAKHSTRHPPTFTTEWVDDATWLVFPWEVDEEANAT